MKEKILLCSLLTNLSWKLQTLYGVGNLFQIEIILAHSNLLEILSKIRICYNAYRFDTPHYLGSCYKVKMSKYFLSKLSPNDFSALHFY